ncbi:MAG: hypothetical protein MUF71_11710 [Candidatus Kapabacteria bacterium]|nr:hypothetical protein [Candidatus Kapabacteria bacterium]
MSAQVEHVPVAHPVYDFLMHAEARGVFTNFSSTMFPLQRKEITAALAVMRQKDTLLSEAERKTLGLFEREFRLVPAERAIVLPSPSDSAQLFFNRLLTQDEKFLLNYSSSLVNVSVTPLLSAEVRWANGENTRALLGTYGGRIFGTIDSAVGFFLQGTSTGVLAGSSAYLLQDAQLFKNPTFRLYNSRFINWSESHVRYDNRWFYAGIGRETRLIGSGYLMRSIMSDNATAADAFMLGARFPVNTPDAESGFEYRFQHFSLLAEALDVTGAINPRSAGAGTIVPAKFMAFHRAAFRSSWGEVGVWESVVYSNRGMELAYMTPFTFLKGGSDNLRDRDNAALGVDLTLRPLPGVQFKGNFMLDDVEFGRLGRDSTGRFWWQNKIAWNAGVMLSPAGLPFDATVEYAQVTPYTYTHFDRQNAMTQDGILFTGTLPPNSDEIKAQVRWFFGGRYPLALTAAYRRHGRNTFDAQGKLLANVGGDVLYSLRRDPRTFQYTDDQTVIFLEGDREDRFTLTFSGGLEIVRNVNCQFFYRYTLLQAQQAQTPFQPHSVGVLLRFEDF